MPCMLLNLRSFADSIPSVLTIFYNQSPRNLLLVGNLGRSSS